MGNILLPYDYDGNVPVYGFGGLLPNTQGPPPQVATLSTEFLKGVSHCFHVNGNPNNPEVHGVAGLLNAYQQSFNAGVRLSGPTFFAPVIKNAATVRHV